MSCLELHIPLERGGRRTFGVSLECAQKPDQAEWGGPRGGGRRSLARSTSSNAMTRWRTDLELGKMPVTGYLETEASPPRQAPCIPGNRWTSTGMRADPRQRDDQST